MITREGGNQICIEVVQVLLAQRSTQPEISFTDKFSKPNYTKDRPQDQLTSSTPHVTRSFPRQTFQKKSKLYLKTIQSATGVVTSVSLLASQSHFRPVLGSKALTRTTENGITIVIVIAFVVSSTLDLHIKTKDFPNRCLPHNSTDHPLEYTNLEHTNIAQSFAT